MAPNRQHDDAIVVGADEDDDNGAISISVHLFAQNGNTWTHQAKLIAPDGVAYNNFGISVGIFSNTLVVGADEDDNNENCIRSTFLFHWNSGAWTYRAKLLAPD